VRSRDFAMHWREVCNWPEAQFGGCINRTPGIEGAADEYWTSRDEPADGSA
jgi:hypothetical protein